MPDEKEARRGAAFYSPFFLRFYDVQVLGITCSAVWRCPSRATLELYDRNAGASHVDFGPGTGYFLDKCCFPVPDPHIALIDLSESPLKAAAKRIERYQPVTYRRNALEPLNLGDEEFESAGLGFFLHCLPGSMAEKTIVFDQILPYLKPGGRIFGSTVLTHGVKHSPQARIQLRALNWTGAFHNTLDSLDDLDAELGRRFAEYRVTVRGSVALFEATL